jgi:hypothetical protein
MNAKGVPRKVTIEEGESTMFARLTILQVNTERLDETIKLLEQSVVPSAR